MRLIRPLKPRLQFSKDRHNHYTIHVQLSKALQGIIPGPLEPLVPNHYEVIGSIAVLTLPEELLPYQRVIAECLMAQRHNITTVLRRASKRKGANRIAGYQPIIGTDTETIYRESGFCYKVDLAHAFFTSRLAGERQRIAAQIKPDELVLVPFAGVGPFVIPTASRGSRVIAIEINPDACRLLEENIRLNSLDGEVMVIRGDACLADRMLCIKVDRAIIPTPYGLDEAFAPLSRMVRQGGVIHYYTFHNRNGVEELAQRFLDSGYQVTRLHRCGNVAPSVSRWVFDLIVGPDARELNIFTGCG
jgi:tRNA (guanine37-N1)-methyltransferase